MKLTIEYRPQFRVSVTRVLLDGMMVCSRHHYDAVCKSASIHGGLLWGVKNRFEWAAECAESKSVHEWTWTWREMDTLMKVVEGADGMVRAGLLTPTQLFDIHTFIDLFRGAQDLANQRDDHKTEVSYSRAPPVETEPARPAEPTFEYFHRKDDCTAEHPTQDGCHCWYAEGTGPFPDARHDTAESAYVLTFKWRDVATKVWL